MWAWQFSKAQYVARANLDLGVGVIPWSPLARDRLTRDWDATTSRSETDEFGTVLDADADADQEIVGATKPSHIDDAIASLHIELTDGEVTRLESPYTTRRTAGFA